MDDNKFLELVSRIENDPWSEFYLKGTLLGGDVDYPEADPERLKSLGKAMTIRKFCALLWQTLKFLRPDLKFYPAYPDYVMEREGPTRSSPQVPDETVTWGIIKQVPGSLGAQPFSSRRELKPRLRDIINIEGQTPETRNGGLKETYGQWMDNLVQFDVWTKDNDSAEDLAEWFKSFMLEYESVWYERGIQKILFWERLRDDTIFKWKNGLSNRSLQWFIRTEELTVKESSKIKAINVQLQKLEEHLLQHWVALRKAPKA